MSAALFLVAVAAAAAVGTWLMRRYALAGRLLDVPNARSSHSVPTPRGGGVAIVVSFLLAIGVLAFSRAIGGSVAIAFAGAGALVAVIGLLDDHRHVAPRWRLLAHFTAAAWLLGWLGGAPPVALLGRTLEPGLLGNILAAVALVWLLNLYNFMDGIDGLASLEAVTCCVGGAILLVARPGVGDEWLAAAALGAATFGFLVWNFPPARIFMGDAGSGFLGVTLGGLALRAAVVDPVLLWSWLILLGVFVVDATLTLLRRLARRERVYEAHRSHAYQHAAARLGAHRPVSVGVAAINLVWLLPVATLVSAGRLAGLAGLALAWTPLVGLALWFRAGATPAPDSRARVAGVR